MQSVLLSLLGEVFVFCADGHKVAPFFVSALLMSRWSWKEGHWTEKGEGTGEDEESSQRTNLKERNPWLTPTESCASDETEESYAKPFRAPLGWSDPCTEEDRIRGLNRSGVRQV